MKYLLLLACCGLPALLSAQKFVVQADKMNKVYSGIENTLTIVSGSCGCDALTVTADKGRIEKAGGCQYRYLPAGPGLAELTVSEKKGSKTTVIGKSLLRVKSLPDPQAVVGGRKGGIVPLNYFKAQLGVSVQWENVDADIPFRIREFTFKVMRKGIAVVKLDIQGNLFQGDCKQAIDQLIAGDQVTIEHIRGVSSGGVIRPLNDLTFTMQ